MWYLTYQKLVSMFMETDEFLWTKLIKCHNHQVCNLDKYRFYVDYKIKKVELTFSVTLDNTVWSIIWLLDFIIDIYKFVVMPGDSHMYSPELVFCVYSPKLVCKCIYTLFYFFYFQPLIFLIYYHNSCIYSRLSVITVSQIYRLNR